MARRKLGGEIPWPEGRTPNDPWSLGPTPLCYDCENDALIEVGQDPRSGTPQMAPCPWCRKGFQVEYGYGGETDNQGRVVFYQDDSYWGPRGYWRNGGDPPPRRRVRERTESDDELLMSMEENARRTKILMLALARGGFVTNPEMLEELYRGDPEGLAKHHEEIRKGQGPENAAQTIGYYRRWADTPQRRGYLRESVIPRLRHQGLDMAADGLEEWLRTVVPSKQALHF